MGDMTTIVGKAMREKDEAKKNEIWKTLTEVDAPKYLAYFETGLGQSTSGFLVGSKMSLADMLVFDLTTGMLASKLPSLDKYPKVKALCVKVGANPGIKAWVAARK